MTGFTRDVPGRAPAGSYVYTIYYGDYPSAPEDSCSFTFEKLGPGANGALDYSGDHDFLRVSGWEVSDLTAGSTESE